MNLKKKILPLCMCGLMLVSAAACEETKTVQTGDSAIVWTALSTDKYMRDQKMETYNEPKLDFVGMKGETTALQVMITANEHIKSFDLEISDLTSADGTEFSADNIKPYAERYVDVYDPFINGKNKSAIPYTPPAGYYPDALVPLDRYIKNREAKIEEGHNQGIWVDCVIPVDATPGNYTGTFTVSYGNKTQDIPVTLKVYDLTMPEEVHSQTMFGIWYEELAYGEGDLYNVNTNQTYYDYLASKRLASDDLPPEHMKNIDTFIAYISERAAEDPKITAYMLTKALIGYDIEVLVPKPENEERYPEARREQEAEKLKTNLIDRLSKILDANLALRAEGNEDIDLFKKLILACEDEPSSEYRIKRVRVFAEILTSAKRAVVEKYETALVDHPDLKESIEKVAQICASNRVDKSLFVSSKNGADEEYVPDYEKGDGLTTWCPEGYMFKDKAFRDVVKERQALGERFTWYTCVANSPVMSYFIECMPVSMRMYSWMQYEYGVEGILYSDTVHWSGKGDPYENPYQNGWGAGESMLLYPGAKYGLQTPVSSIRLEQLFHGQQDYEYFYMLDAYLTANEIETSAAELIEKWLVNLRDGAYTLETATGADLERSRIQVLDLLQDFADGDITAAQTKINEIMN